MTSHPTDQCFSSVSFLVQLVVLLQRHVIAAQRGRRRAGRRSATPDKVKNSAISAAVDILTLEAS
ncbi:MAG TPA: hypothetical protein VLL30_14225 [Reyranella sp.]|nr:hypothetical protein [Reyranella sp.]